MSTTNAAAAPAATPASPTPTTTPAAPSPSGLKPPVKAGAAGQKPANAAPPKREPVMWRPDGAEAEIDVSPFLSRYEREVIIDGKPRKVHVEDAFAEFSKGRVADQRLSQMDRERRAFEAERSQFQAMRDMLNIDPKRPESAHQAMDFGARMLQKRWGAENWRQFVVSQFAELAAFEKLTPEQQQATMRERAYREDLDRRAAEVSAKERMIKEAEAKEAARRQKAHVERVSREWPPMLSEFGVPAAWATRGIEMMIGEIRKSRELKMTITEREAARRVGAKLARELEALRPPSVAVQDQPGREPPPAEEQPEPSPKRAREERAPRPEDWRRSWGRG